MANKFKAGDLVVILSYEGLQDIPTVGLVLPISHIVCGGSYLYYIEHESGYNHYSEHELEFAQSHIVKRFYEA